MTDQPPAGDASPGEPTPPRPRPTPYADAPVPPPGPPPPPGYGPPPGYRPPPGYGYPAPPPPGYGVVSLQAGMVVDPASGLVIPQGTELAGVGRRIGAFFLTIPLAIVTLFVGYVIWGLIAWTKGTTPALQVLGCKVWRPAEQRVAGFWWMALRNVVGRALEGFFFGLVGLVGFILMCAQRDRRTIHDLIAQTVVIHDPDKVVH